MIGNIPIDPYTSIWQIRLSYFIGILTKPIRLICHLLTIILSGMFRVILFLWKNIYNFCYDNRTKLIKYTRNSLLFVEAILLVIFCFQYFYNDIYKSDLIYCMCGLVLSSGCFALLCYLYYIFFGQYILLDYYILLTDEYVESHLAYIIKIFGPPRIGKDTTGISFTSILVRRNKRMIVCLMKKIKKICYIFDFEKVNNACNIYSRAFYSTSKNKRRNNFILLCSNKYLKSFLKERYLEKINYREFIREYIDSLENKIDFNSNFIYDDGKSRVHFLELLNEYMFLYVRLYIMKNFSMTNQPYLEDPETGLMSKQYSVYYEALTSSKDKIIDGIVYKEKIESPIIDWTIVNLSENDTWFNNTDSKVVKLINEYKIRDSKAFYGHFYESMYYIQICHDAARMNKKLRELDAFYINVLHRTEITGAPKRVAILSLFQKITNYIASKGTLKLEDCNNTIIYKKQRKIDYLNKLYNASGNDKYLALIDKEIVKELQQLKRIYDIFAKWNEKLIQYIEKLKVNKGVIRITATISDQPTTPNLKLVTMRELVKRSTPLYHESYKVDFYFRMTDSIGRYNHKYMSNVLESRAFVSTLDYINVLNWDKRMELSKQIMLQMGFPSGFELYNITPDEVFENRYYPTNK